MALRLLHSREGAAATVIRSLPAIVLSDTGEARDTMQESTTGIAMLTTTSVSRNAAWKPRWSRSDLHCPEMGI